MLQFGKYKVSDESHDKLGSGGYGAVYRAWDPDMEREVAVKVLHTPAQGDIQREARIMARLEHESIALVYDGGAEHGQPYLVMEFVEGISVAERIQTDPPLPIWEKADILRRVAEGVACAHRAKVIHRDLKPSNNLLPWSGGVKILDFGISRLEDQSLSGVIRGTSGYLAPELLLGHPPDKRSDIFAFGVTAFILLSGVAPAECGATPPGIPEALWEVVRKATAKEPKDRYQRCEDLSFDLQQFICDLSEQRANDKAAEAERTLRDGDLETAQSLVSEVLKLAPAHKLGGELAQIIRGQRARAIQERKVRELVAVGDAHMEERMFAPALEAFESAWKSSPTAASSELRGEVERRLEVARKARDTAVALAKLLAEAHAAADRGDVGLTSRRVAEILEADPANQEAASVLQQLCWRLKEWNTPTVPVQPETPPEPVPAPLPIPPALPFWKTWKLAALTLMIVVSGATLWWRLHGFGNDTVWMPSNADVEQPRALAIERIEKLLADTARPSYSPEDLSIRRGLLNKLAKLYRDSRQYSKAVNTYNQISALSPKHESDTFVTIIDTYLLAGDFESANQTISLALKQFPEDPDVLIASARVLVCEGKTSEAVAQLRNRSNERAGTSCRQATELVKVYLLSGLLGDAAEVLVSSAAMASCEEHSAERISFLRGALFKASGQYAKAEAEYRKASSLDTSDALIHYYMGDLFEEQHRFDNAESEFRKARWLFDPPYGPSVALVRLFERQGKREAAEYEYAEISEIETDPKQRASLADALADHSVKLHKAFQLVKPALKVAPFDSTYLDTLGLIYFQ